MEAFVAWSTLKAVEDCRAKLHRQAFRVIHNLAGHPLFTLDTLIGVAQQAAKRRRDLYVDAGKLSFTDKWGNIPAPALPVSELVKRIETAEAWIIMKHVETDPRYKAVLDEFTSFVHALAGPEASKSLLNPEMLVLITSPNRVMPFHFDAECNFLVQIHGSNDVWICDPTDRTITTETEIEYYYSVPTTVCNFKPHAEQRSTRFVLAPGDAVHIPTHGAHWVKNHNNVSVSLSLNFELPKVKHADVYRAHYYLRRLGLHPEPPGKSIVVDRAKAATVAASRPVNPPVAAATRPIRRLLRG
jgi:hypothetical protein